jgi:hypothetical protein
MKFRVWLLGSSQLNLISIAITILAQAPGTILICLYFYCSYFLFIL